MVTSLLSLCFAASRKRSYQKEEAGYIYIYIYEHGSLKQEAVVYIQNMLLD